MSFRKTLSIIIAVAFMLMPAAGCGGGVDYEAIELVPEGADMIFGIKVSEAIRNWQVYEEVEGTEESSGQYEEAKEQVLEESGLDLSEISEVVVFGDMSDMDNAEYIGIIMTGNFAEKEMVSRIEEKTGASFTTEEYGGYTLYEDAGSSFVAISNKLVIMGMTDAVKDCIDVANGETKRLSGVVMDTYNSLGDVVARLAMVLPDDFREAFAEQTDDPTMPVGLEPFADMQTLGMAVDMDTQAMTVKVSADFSTPDSATDAADSMETIMGFLAMMSQDEESAELFDRVEVSVGGSRMYLNYEMSLAELAEMRETFQSGTGFPMVPTESSDIEFPSEDDTDW